MKHTSARTTRWDSSHFGRNANEYTARGYAVARCCSPAGRIATWCLALALFASACADGSSTQEQSTPPLPLPSVAASTASVAPPADVPTIPESLALTDSSLPVANLRITALPGEGVIDADSFAEIDIGDDPAGDAVHIMTSFTPVGPMSYYEWTNTSGEPCVGFTEEGVASWGCGSARPVSPVGKPAWLRLGASWNSSRYTITPDPLPPSAIAVETITDTGYRVRTIPIDGYAILADTFENGIPVQVVVYFDDDSQLVQATNFAFVGAPLD